MQVGSVVQRIGETRDGTRLLEGASKDQIGCELLPRFLSAGDLSCSYLGGRRHLKVRSIRESAEPRGDGIGESVGVKLGFGGSPNSSEWKDNEIPLLCRLRRYNVRNESKNAKGGSGECNYQNREGGIPLGEP